MSEYDKEVENIAKEFIQTITIIDDKASYDSKGDGFNADQIIKKFAEDGKICSVFRFSDETDIDKIVRVSQKSDITILDWKMNLSPSQSDEIKLAENEEDDEEEDVVISKGHFTLEILKQIVPYEHNKLKLYVIYTDETEFSRIIDEIETSLKDLGILTKMRDSFSFFCNNNKVIILGKEEVKTKVNHLENQLVRCFNHDELPNAIYSEYSQITKGIVSSIFLKSISAIRENTFTLLDTFKRDLDAAFIAHKSVLPDPEDAHEHILDLIGSEIKSVLNGYVDNETTSKLINHFIDTLDEKHLVFNVQNCELTSIGNVPKTLSKLDFKKLLQEGVVAFCGFNDMTVKQKMELTRECVKIIPNIIIKSIEPDSNKTIIGLKIKESHTEFAKLTTTKKKYSKSQNIFLTLGVILKSKNVGGEDEYWICVQPKCDCLRINRNENRCMGRYFTFLSLSKRKTGGEIQISASVSLKVEYSIPKSKQIIFRPLNECNIIQAKIIGSDIFFLDRFGKRYDFVCELKNDFAQSISNTYAAQISRVGMNHSEWLRLNALKF